MTAYAYGKARFGEQGSFVAAVLDSKARDYLYEVVPSCASSHIEYFQYGFSFHSESSVCELAFLLGGIFS